MFILYANKNQLAVRCREPLTSGSVNVYLVRFEFSPEWNGLARTAVFRAGTEMRSVPLDDSGQCTIPWEVLAFQGRELSAGIYGTRDSKVILPTVWVSLGPVLEGVLPGEDSKPPTPDLWEQELARKGDTLNYTQDGDLGLYAGDRLLSAVPISGGGGGGGGTSDHRLLSYRDAENQHTIRSVSGLQTALDTIPAPVEALTNQELEELLK